MKIIVPADSSLSSLNELRGHHLTVTDINSNSGFKAPLVLLREHGLLPPRDYDLSFSNGHTASIARVKSKLAEAAAVSGEVLQIEEAAGHISPGDYKVLYTSDQMFPGAAIGCPNVLKPELAAKIKTTLLGFDWKATGLESAGLFATGGKDWEYVRRIDESFGYAYTLAPVKGTTQPTTRLASR
jgi:phosphonate transport system substrate-binding protein